MIEKLVDAVPALTAISWAEPALAVPGLIVALALAMPIARLAYRLPARVKLRCWKCGWICHYASQRD